MGFAFTGSPQLQGEEWEKEEDLPGHGLALLGQRPHAVRPAVVGDGRGLNAAYITKRQSETNRADAGAGVNHRATRSTQHVRERRAFRLDLFQRVFRLQASMEMGLHMCANEPTMESLAIANQV